MAGRYSLLKQKVVRARSRGSCAAKHVPTVIHYWRVSALVRDVYWTGSFVSESYRLVKNRSGRLGGVMQVAGCDPLVAMCSITCCCPYLGASIESPFSCLQPSGIRKDGPDQRWQTVVWQAASAGQGHGLGPQRNWQAVSEKSKWAVSGSNQRDAWKHWPSARECARI